MTLETLIKEQLDPHLVEVDEGTYYPRTFIQQLFVDGYFGEAALRKNAEVIEAVS
ncbi:acyl-CoA dehydrogenase, partial [Escherichia coli]|nr:acyl-CoA dehydrogenase [Escherichia coli]